MQHFTYSVYQWIGNFDPKMSSLGLLEAKIVPKLRTTAIIVMVVIFVIVAVVKQLVVVH